MSKGLDRIFLEYGIRKTDLDIISSLCKKYELDEDWIKEKILKHYHEEKVSKLDMDDATVEKVIKKALQQLTK